MEPLIPKYIPDDTSYTVDSGYWITLPSQLRLQQFQVSDEAIQNFRELCDKYNIKIPGE